MPFDGSGNFIPLGLPDFPAIGGQPIYATQFNNVISDLMGGFASVLTRDGQSSMTGDLQMSGNKLIGLEAATGIGQALAFGQVGAQLHDLGIAVGLTAGGPITGQNLSAVGAVASDTFVDATVSATARIAMGFNATAGLSGISTPAGAAYIGSPQNVDLHVGLGGTTRVSFKSDGRVLFSQRLETNSQEALRINNDGAYISFFNSAGNTQRGYVQGNTIGSGDIRLGSALALNIVLINASGSAYLVNDGKFRCDGGFVGNISGSAGSAAAVPWSGVSGKPTTLAGYGITDGGGGVTSVFGRTGAVALTSADVTGALGFSPLSGISGGMVTAALGYTPYNSTNPSGFITGISSGMVTTALGYTPYNGASNPFGFLTNADTAYTISGTDAGFGYRTTGVTLSKVGTTARLTVTGVYNSSPETGG